jgi:HNH endonuclease
MSSYISVRLQRQIRSQFRDCCAYCQTSESLLALTFEFEHIMPTSAGGETQLENLCLACPSCNRFKASRQMGMDSVTGETVRLFHPQLDDWGSHFRWSEDATEIVALTATGRVTIELLRMNRPMLIDARAMWVEVGRHPRQ